MTDFKTSKRLLPPIENEAQLDCVQSMVDMLNDRVLKGVFHAPDQVHANIVLNELAKLIFDYEAVHHAIGDDDEQV
jgi:hypothetical protein